VATTLYWLPQGLPDALVDALRALAAEYPLREAEGRPTLEFAPDAPAGSLQVSRSGNAIRIAYGELCDALRGVGAALAGLPSAGGVISERRPFTTLGIMLDCSRNAVMEVEHLRVWLRRLALFGCNMMMLYTEDTYQLPGEPWFGWLRGAYSADPEMGGLPPDQGHEHRDPRG
jgi:hexosaminidase